jgi:hypothetical protein
LLDAGVEPGFIIKRGKNKNTISIGIITQITLFYYVILDLNKIITSRLYYKK